MTPEQIVEEIQSDYRVTALKINGVDMRGYTIAADTTILRHNEAAKAVQSLIYERTGYWFEIVAPDKADKSIIIKAVAKDATVPEGFKISSNEQNQLIVECAYDNMLERDLTEFVSQKVVSAEGEVDLKGEYKRNISTLTYEEFGAKGDGVTNDFVAIYDTHNMANEGGQKVLGTPGKTYYIEAPLINKTAVDIIIRTNTDWQGAKFIIDDRKISQTDDTKSWGTVDIVIASGYANPTITKNESNKAVFDALIASGLNPETRKLDVKALLALADSNYDPNNPYAVMLSFSDSSHKIFRRRGYDTYGGASMKDLVILDKDGNIDPDTYFMWDYNNVTSIAVKRIDDAPITIENATFTTRASQFNCIFTNAKGQKDDYSPYLNRGLSVRRSNTTIKNIEHYVTDEKQYSDMVDASTGLIQYVGSTYRGFYRTSSCTDVIYENCVMTGRRCYLRPNGGGTGGTYDVTCGTANRVTFKNCTQSNFWVTVDSKGDIKAAKKGDEGAVLGMGYYPGTDFKVVLDKNAETGEKSNTSMHWGVANTSFSKNVAYVDSTLSRFDAHEGIYNGKIIGSTVQTVALTGGGHMVLKDTTIFPDDGNPRAFGVRKDYGSSFMGSITAENLSIIAPAKNDKGKYVNHYIMQRESYENWYYGYKVTVPNLTLSDVVFYDYNDYDLETDTYAQVPDTVPIYLYGDGAGTTVIKANTTHHLAEHMVRDDKHLWPIYSLEDKDKDGYIDIPDIDGDGVWGNTEWKYADIKFELDKKGLNVYQKGYTHEGSTVNLNIVVPPEYVKVLSNKGGYKFVTCNTGVNAGDESKRVSNGGHHGVAENWKGFYGSTKFYYGPGENDFVVGPPTTEEELNKLSNLYTFY